MARLVNPSSAVVRKIGFFEKIYRRFLVKNGVGWNRTILKVVVVKTWSLASIKAAGLGDEPRRVLEELAKIRAVDVVLPTRLGPEIRRRCVSQPTDHQAILLQRLGLHLPKNLPLAGQFLKKM